MNLAAAFEVHWIVLYFVILAGCAWLWTYGGVGFEGSDSD
jgi:hypothetical protein